MADDSNIQQPRQPRRGLDHYKKLKQEITASHPEPTPTPASLCRKEIFDVRFTGYNYGGDMTENDGIEPQTFIEMVFKPKQFGRLLRPAESQLILSFMDEILADAREEEKVIIEEEKAASLADNKGEM